MAVPFQYYGYSFMSCKLKMDINHPKWQKTLRKILDCIKVYRFNMDEYGTVLVSGRTNPYVLLNKIGKAGKRAELVLLQSGECSGCLNIPPSSANPPPQPPPPPPVVTDDGGDRRYANGYSDYSRRYNPYYNAYGGDYHYGGGEGGYGYSHGYDRLGNDDGGGYGGWSGYDYGRPRHSHRPFGEWYDFFTDPDRNTSSGW